MIVVIYDFVESIKKISEGIKSVGVIFSDGKFNNYPNYSLSKIACNALVEANNLETLL